MDSRRRYAAIRASSSLQELLESEYGIDARSRLMSHNNDNEHSVTTIL